MGTRIGFRATITEAFAATVIGESGQAKPPSLPFRRGRLPEPGDIIGGHYRLVRVLGEGMFGKVYVAERVDVPAHQVALKVVPREVYSGRNVERELVMLAAASHPNIVQLKDHGTTQSFVWLTMPVYEGETLANRLERGPLGLEEAYEVFLPIARALDALHKAGLRHQDIKPENIFLARFGGRLHPILLDLGVAAEKEANFVAGTILYASPEQLSALSSTSATLPLSDKMDTYCLAATLLLALVGPAYFPGEGADCRLDIVKAQEVRARTPIAHGALLEVRGAPRKLLSAAFCRWMDADPLHRPSVRVMADELEVLLEPERAQERARSRRRSRIRFMGRMTVAATLLVASAGALFAYSKRETIRLASELDRARAQGAASFSELDTCVASHQLAKREVIACEEARSQKDEEYRAKIQKLAKSGGATEASYAKQIQTLETTYASRMKWCEDEKNGVQRARAAERDQLTWDSQRKELQLTTERDEQRMLAESRGRELERCRSDLTAPGRSPGRDHPSEMPASTPGDPLTAPADPASAPKRDSQGAKHLPVAPSEPLPAAEPGPHGARGQFPEHSLTSPVRFERVLTAHAPASSQW